MAQNILRLPNVQSRVKKSRSSIYLEMSRGDFPKPIKLGPRSVGWLESEVDEWIEKQIKKSRGSAGR